MENKTDYTLAEQILEGHEHEEEYLAIIKDDNYAIEYDFASDLEMEFENYKLQMEGLTTGFPSIDKFLYGLKKGDFLLVGGSTSSGKSTLCYQMAIHFAEQGINTAIFPFEDNREERGTRISRIMNGLIKNKKIKDRLFEMDGDIAIIKDDDASYIIRNLDQVVPALEALSLKLNAKVLILDMLNNLIDTSKSDTANEFMNSLKVAAAKLGIVIIATARLREPVLKSDVNRKQEKLTPDEDSISGQGHVKYSASKIITLVQAPAVPISIDELNAGKLPSMDREIWCYVPKCRMGRTTSEYNGRIVLKTKKDEKSNTLWMEDCGVTVYGTD
jgi:archaellum biogenesis ATPase FlaH